MSRFAVETLFSVKGLHVLITGGATGLGLYMAKGFVSNGAAIVYIVGRRENKLREAKTELEALASDGCRVVTITCDVSKRNELEELASQLKKLDVLINCAGLVIPDTPCTHLTPIDELQAALKSSPSSTWSGTFSVNVESPFYLSVLLLHLLAASETSGRIINISSIGSTMSDPVISQPAYQASKAALNHLTRLLASKFRNTGIRVNAISPGYFPSQMNDPSNPKSMVSKAKDLVPIKRAGMEEDIAGTAIWLASTAGSYVNGQVIVLGGGREWA